LEQVVEAGAGGFAGHGQAASSSHFRPAQTGGFRQALNQSFDA
jgi:hypothetical protein